MNESDIEKILQIVQDYIGDDSSDKQVQSSQSQNVSEIEPVKSSKVPSEIELKVGMRFLYRLIDHYEFVVYEGILQEISPSGFYIKINNTWIPKSQLRILEILKKKSGGKV